MSNDFYIAFLTGWFVLIVFWSTIIIFVYIRKPPNAKLTKKVFLASYGVFFVILIISSGGDYMCYFESTKYNHTYYRTAVAFRILLDDFGLNKSSSIALASFSSFLSYNIYSLVTQYALTFLRLRNSSHRICYLCYSPV